MENRKEKRATRGHKIPVDYIDALSDRIHQTSPTKEILNNTLEGFYSIAYTKGYMRHLSDDISYRNQKKQRFEEEWNKILEEIDDLVHPEKNTNQNKK